MTICKECGLHIEKIRVSRRYHVRTGLGNSKFIEGGYYELPFTCNYCGGKFCSKHRLPENHSCPKFTRRSNIGSSVSTKESKRILNIKYDSPEGTLPLHPDDHVTLENENISSIHENTEHFHNGQMVEDDDNGTIWFHGKRHSIVEKNNEPLLDSEKIEPVINREALIEVKSDISVQQTKTQKTSVIVFLVIVVLSVSFLIINNLREEEIVYYEFNYYDLEIGNYYELDRGVIYSIGKDTCLYATTSFNIYSKANKEEIPLELDQLFIMTNRRFRMAEMNGRTLVLEYVEDV